ncbi:MAG: class I SAM-dependent methyltransferase [Solirubrobacterales bacterium]
MSTLAEAWDAAAEDWIRWARAPDHDHFYWRFIRPHLLDLIPPPRRLTVDIGCGEGRLARELQRCGHQVVGVEPSRRLAAAAGAARPSVRVLIADATAMPLEDEQADIAVACMSLLNIENLSAAVREVSRILVPGGKLCFATLHPLHSIAAARNVLGPCSYFNELRFADTAERDGLRMTFHDVHRSLSDICAALETAGFLIETLREPVPDEDHVRSRPGVVRWREQPCFLHGRALKPPTGP